MTTITTRDSLLTFLIALAIVVVLLAADLNVTVLIAPF
jgi:hypothetical protein